MCLLVSWYAFPSKVAFHHNSSLGRAAITHWKWLPDAGHDFLSKLMGCLGHQSWHWTSKHYTHILKLASWYLSFLQRDFLSPSFFFSLPPVSPVPVTVKKKLHLQFLPNIWNVKTTTLRCAVTDVTLQWLIWNIHSHNVIQLSGVGVPVPAAAAQRHIAPT